MISKAGHELNEIGVEAEIQKKNLENSKNDINLGQTCENGALVSMWKIYVHG